jgi:hypothetical protein
MWNPKSDCTTPDTSPLFGQTESRLLEWLDHCATSEEAQVTASLGRTRILRVLLGKLGKISRAGLHLHEQTFNLLPGSLECSLTGILGRLNQNMADAPLLALAEALRMGVVLLAQIRIAQTQLPGKCLLAEHQILGTNLGRNLEPTTIGVVELLSRPIGQFDGSGVLLGTKADFADLTLLELNSENALSGGP